MAALLVLLGLAAVLTVTAAIALRRAARAEARFRRDLLADCAFLLDGPTSALDAAGYGVLRGRCAGFAVALRPFAEALAFRRLPQLWLAATVRAATGSGASLDIVRRPSGAEFYSAGDGFAHAFAPPPEWPQDTQVRGDRAAGALLLRLSSVLAGPLADPRTKSVLVTPSGVRVVRQLAQGSRGSYLVFRDARFDLRRAPTHEVRGALDLAARIATTLASTQTTSGPENTSHAARAA